MSQSKLLLTLFVLGLGISLVVGTGHENNWAVLVAGSRYWFNYRHMANVLSVYHSIKKLGIPDSQIIVMLADDVACNDRNVFKAQVIASHGTTKYNTRNQHEGSTGNLIEIYDNDVEVDYRGEECNVENVLRVLTGRHNENVAINKRLNTNSESNILLYMTGHGGDTFLKFHDKEEIQTQDLSDAFEIMWTEKRYKSILFIVDTCQAATLFDFDTSSNSFKNILSIGSSKLGESSYSYRTDKDLGISIIDRFTYFILRFFEKGIYSSNLTLIQLFNSFEYKFMKSTVTYNFDHYKNNETDINDIKITQYFASANNVDMLQQKDEITVNYNTKDVEKHKNNEKSASSKRDVRSEMEAKRAESSLETDSTLFSMFNDIDFYTNTNLILLTSLSILFSIERLIKI